jgi:uncharacterized protein (DUF983 family)
MAAGDRDRRFFREVPVDDAALAIRRFFTTNFVLRCPACGRGRVTRGPLAVGDQCPHCGARFKRLEGNELISISLSFFLSCIVTFLVALPLILRYGFFPGVTWVLVGVGVVAAVALLRPMRVLALWLLWLIGFIYADNVSPGSTIGSVIPARQASGSAFEGPARGSSPGGSGQGSA